MRGSPCRRALNEGWVVSAAGYYSTQRLFPVGQFGVGEGVVYFGMQAGTGRGDMREGVKRGNYSGWL